MTNSVSINDYSVKHDRTYYNDDLKISDNYNRYREYVAESIKTMKLNISPDDYIYVDRIGEGTFGTVELCNRNKKLCVLKIIEKTKSVLINDVYMEIYLQYSLNHPKIVKCNGWFEDEYNYYIELEYIEGCDLFDKTRMNNLDPDDALYYVREILDILLYLKANHVIHRDIKLENILLDKKNNVYLCDFGLATIMSPGTAITKQEERFAGTLEYVTPEAIDYTEYGYGTDIWALGIMLYELVYKKYPFKKSRHDAYDILGRIKTLKIQYSNLPQFALINDLLRNMLVIKELRITVEQSLKHKVFDKTLTI